MGHKKLTLIVLVILLVAGVVSISACAPEASSTRSIESASSLGQSASGAYSQAVQGSAQAVPDWQQVNSNGFGDPQTGEVTALEAFNGYLYAGTFNSIDFISQYDGAQIFRSPDGVTWTPVTQPGFGNTHDIAPPAILDFIIFNNRLYAGTGRGNASQIWRTSNGTIWAPMDVTGFSDPDNVDITALAVYNGMIYAGVRNQVTGAQVWRSFTGDNNSWTQVAPETPGTVAASITGFAEFDGALYAAVESEAPAQIWQSYGGTLGTWTTVVSDGFGDSNNLLTGGMAVFGGYLYVGEGNTANGAQLWRTNDGATWEQAIAPGFGDANNQKVEMVFVFQNQLYAGVKNAVTGMQIWRSTDGTLWEQANQDGFGDSNNTGTNWSNASADFMNQLYVGTSNVVDGGELWRKLEQLNNPPTDISLSNASVDENQPVNTVVGTLNATDPDAGGTFTFSLACTVEGADDGSFNILGANLRTSAMFDFETKSSYNICLRVTDQGGLTFDKNFVITVNNVNEAPTDISLSNTNVDENQPVNTVVGTVSATDPDATATFTFSLACAVAGADDGSFNILGTSLRTSAMFDFETKSTYNICLRVTDQGGLTFDENFVITVNNLAENNAPTDISLSNTAVGENQPVNTVVGTLSATDPDAGGTFTFNLACAVAGADDGSFNILGTSLRTSAIFDFETKSTYTICIRVTDQGGLTFDENFVITVNNLAENNAPTDISLSNTAVGENQPLNTVVGALSATDPDAGGTFTFNLTCTVAGADDDSFNILGANLRTSAMFDFETKSTYTICLRVTDQGGLTFDKNFAITVNNVNEAPTDIFLSNASVDENQPVNTVVGTLSAADPDAGATFTFSLGCAIPGADDGFFNILGIDLRTSAMFDFETKSAYDFCVRVTDQGGLNFDKNFAVSVNDLYDPTNTPGKVTGGGNIDLSNGKVTFGFVVQYRAGDASPSGNLTFVDHSTKLNLKATSFDLLVIEGDHAWFTGTGVMKDGQEVKFEIEVEALSKLDQPDTFYIYIPEMNGYRSGGALTGGNIKIHK